jgi:hypothetical protein
MSVEPLFETVIAAGVAVQVQLSPERAAAKRAEWEAEASAPTPVPQSVTPRQARLALLGAGLLDAVEAAIAQGPRADQITWEFAVDVRRDYALIENLGTALGLTSAEIDNLFRTAATL